MKGHTHLEEILSQFVSSTFLILWLRGLPNSPGKTEEKKKKNARERVWASGRGITQRLLGSQHCG